MIEEVLFFIDNRALRGRGIGFIDARLLASTAIDPNLRLWSRDGRLQKIASDLDLAYGN